MLARREQRVGKYLRPIERTERQIQDMKRMKEEEKGLRDRIRGQVSDRSASKERNDAVVFKYMNDKRRIDALFEAVFTAECVWNQVEDEGQVLDRKAQPVADQTDYKDVQMVPPRKVGEVVA